MMESCLLYIMLLSCMPQSFANPYGYYYPSYSRSRRDPNTAQWEQYPQNYAATGYGGYQQPNMYQQLFNPQSGVQQIPGGNDYQTNYRNNKEAVVPPLVPITGNGNADKDLYSQHQPSNSNSGPLSNVDQQQQGGLYNSYNRGMINHNAAGMQQPSMGAGMYGNDLQKPVRLEDYKQSSMDYGQLGNVQQPSYLPQHAKSNQHAGGLGSQSGVDNGYPPLGGLGMFPDAGSSDMPPKCSGVICDDLTNCINVTLNETDCCPKCVQYGCECGDGYQLYDCQQAGYSDGLVPEGDVYYVNQGLTSCFCTLGGGSITCTEQSETCPETPNCIKKFVIPGACDHCLEYGCTDEDGTTYPAGTSINKPPCEVCYCKPEGGELLCGKLASCVSQEEGAPKKEVAGLDSSIRQIDARGKLDGYTNLGGYPRYGDYGTGFSDYGTYMRPDASQTGAGGKTIPAGQENNKPIVPGQGSSGTNGETSIDSQQPSYQQNPYGYQNPYSNNYGTGGYYNQQNPYPNYGFGSNGFGYNPYALPGDKNSLDSTKQSETNDESDDETGGETGDASVGQEQEQENGGTNAADNSQGTLTAPNNNFQQLYPYYQQPGYDTSGGYAQNPYGYQPYPGQGSLNPGSAEKTAQTSGQDQPSPEQVPHNPDASSQTDHSESNPQPQQNLGGYYPYDPYQQFNPSLYKDPASSQDGNEGNAPAETGTEELPQKPDNVAQPDADAASPDAEKSKVNSISNPYLDPNYRPQLSNYLQQGNQYNQNPYGYGYGAAGYNPYSFGQNSDSGEPGKTTGEVPAEGADTVANPQGVAQGDPQNSNPNPSDPNSPHAGYQQALSGYYPYAANQYYSGYNNPYAAYNMQQQYAQMVQNGLLSPNPTNMGDTVAQPQPSENTDQRNGQKPPQEIARPTKNAIVPDLIPISGDVNERMTEQETDSAYKKAYFEQSDPLTVNKRPNKFLQRLTENSHETTTIPTTTTRPTTTTTTRPTTTTAQTTTTRPTTSTTTSTTRKSRTRRPKSTTTTIRPTTKTITRPQRVKVSTSRTQPSNGTAVSFENVLTRCCMEGRQWVSRYDTCSNIVRSEEGDYPEMCRDAKEKCCLDAQSQQFCKRGINTAREMAACDDLVTDTCSATHFKTCCDCCALGLKAHGWGYDCNVPLFGEPCDTAYKFCCQNGRIQLNPGSHGTDEQAINSRGTNSSYPRPTVAVPLKPVCASDNHCEQLCTDTFRGMQCSCTRGYRLAVDKRTCLDVNECLQNPCTANQLCINNHGSYHCQRTLSCGTGYQLTGDNRCEDIDECAFNLHNCQGNLECDNMIGSFRCKPKLCDDGYFTDATGNCIDFNECLSDDYSCPTGATCININGGYNCECEKGRRMLNKHCIDINECVGSPCNSAAKCINTDGSYRCIDPPTLRCTPGYKPNLLRTTCIDIDECSDGTHTCNQGSTCINERGGFRCQDPLICKPGFKSSEDKLRCIDIDECLDSRKNFCVPGGVCENTQGSWTCTCNEGFSPNMTANGYPTCSDIDECAVGEGRKCAYSCRNLPGSFECICPLGYTVGDFGRNCEDIDECALPGTCSGNETCFNTKGSYKCVNIICPVEYTRRANKCQRKSCRDDKDKSHCVRLPKQISHHNISLKYNSSDDTPIFRMTLARSYRSDKHVFTITEGNEDNCFKVVTSIRGRSPSGVIYTNKNLLGPKEYKIDMTLKLYRRRRWAKFISRVYIFVSAYAFD